MDSKLENIRLVVDSVFAGMMISFGGIAFLLSENKVVGSVFFCFGLLMVVVFSMKLFTGMVATCLELKLRQAYVMVVGYFGNMLGAFLMAELVLHSRLGGTISEKVAPVIETKLGDSPLSLFILGIFCGMMITCAVAGFKKAGEKNLSATVVLLFPVAVFVLCGFEHCVADMFYLFASRTIADPRALVLLLSVTAGNIVGGIIFPLGDKIKKTCHA